VLLVLVLVVSALVAGAPDAGAGPADALPVTIGTYTGWGECEYSGCASQLRLDGRFALNGGSIKAVADLSWSGGANVAGYWGTISSERFEGLCYVQRQVVAVDPVGGVQHSLVVVGLVEVDGGAAADRLVFSYAQGRFFPLGI
jgi:hypothetical protein